MRVLELPAGIAPGSPEAVAFIEAQVPSAADPAAAPEPAAVVATVLTGSEAYDLIIGGLEMMLDGFRELTNDQ